MKLRNNPPYDTAGISRRVLLKPDNGANATVGTGKSGDVSAISTNKESFQLGKLTINVFRDSEALNQNVANQIGTEMTKAGTVILPADSTHGDEPKPKPPGRIYNIINEKIRTGDIKPNERLQVTHMDEPNLSDKNEHWDTAPGKGSFAKALEGWLNHLAKALGDRFYKIDPTKVHNYIEFVTRYGGPRVIVGGVGADTPPHIAYIGEEKRGGKPYINQAAELITLRDGERKRRGVNTAVTMGMGWFDMDTLERVIIDAKGGHKADAIFYALNEALKGKTPEGESALGLLIKKYTQDGGETAYGEMVLNIDADAASKSLDLLGSL